MRGCDTVVGVVLWPSCCRWMKKNWLALINAEAFLFWVRNDWLLFLTMTANQSQNDWLLFLTMTANQSQNDWFLFLTMTANQSQNDWLLLILNDWLLAFPFWERKTNFFWRKFSHDLRKDWSCWIWHPNFCDITVISRQCYSDPHDYMNHHWHHCFDSY